MPGLQHAILIITPNIRIVHASPAAAVMFGRDVSELVGSDAFDLLADVDSERARHAVRERLVERNEGFRGSWNLCRSDGSSFLAEIEVAYVEEPNQDLRILLSILDTSEQHRATKALERALSWTDNLLDISGTLIVSLDAAGRVQRINAEGCRILGYERDWILGRDWFDHFLPERLREQVRGVAQQLYAGTLEPVRFYENPVLTASGEERTIYWHNTIIRDEDGRIVEILSSGLDITDRVLAERERERTLGLAQAR